MNDSGFEFCDELGPEKVIHIHDAATGLKAILVVDNVAAGPSIGGTRMAPDVSLDECFRLARAMTLKNAAAGLPHGGGKSVIFADPRMPGADKERLIRAFAKAVGQITDYIPGPDMGTDETCMAWVKDTIGRAVGLPRDIGGIPLDEIGATGFGLAVAVDVAKDDCDLSLSGARVAIQGFGSVGQHAARFLAEKGARLVAASDSRGCLINSEGIDVAALMAWKASGKPVADYAEQHGGQPTHREAIIDVASDIWIPAARPDVINEANVHRLDTRLVVQGANIPFTAGAEKMLHEKGVLVVPDFIANAGGVICAAVEYHEGSESQAMNVIEEKIRYNTEQVLSRARAENLLPRESANIQARQRVLNAMALRRTY